MYGLWYCVRAGSDSVSVLDGRVCRADACGGGSRPSPQFGDGRRHHHFRQDHVWVPGMVSLSRRRCQSGGGYTGVAIPARIAPETLTFELWPDMSDYDPGDRYTAPGFTHADGSQATLFSAENPKTVRRPFRLDGRAGHFMVSGYSTSWWTFPEGPNKNRYPSRMRVLQNVRDAANATGRVWAIAV